MFREGTVLIPIAVLAIVANQTGVPERAAAKVERAVKVERAAKAERAEKVVADI
jgi:hypothetical protein